MIMLKRRLNLALVAALLLAVAAPSPAQEAKLIAVLKSDASHKDKADACRMLSRVGTKQAVPTLAALLGDEKLAHMARYALEPIPDACVDVALRAAAGKLKGPRLVGVIGSIGVRRDAQAVQMLARLLGDADADVAQAAARAMGKIGTADAAKAIEDALGGVPPGNRVAFCEGLLRCAERLAAGSERERAVAIYDRLGSLPKAAHQVRTAALRGAVLTRGKQGLPLLLKALRDKEYVVFSAAARTSMELADKEATVALAAELGKLPPDRQVLLIQTLGARGDGAAGEALLARAEEGPDPVRLAAIRALTRLGHGPAVAMLTRLSQADKGPLSDEARRCLANFPGKGGQAAVLAMLTHKDPKVRCLAAELIEQRALATATPSLLKAAEDADTTVRLASLKALRSLAGEKDLPVLLGLLGKAKSAAETEAVENAVRSLCARHSSSAAANVVIRKAFYGDLPNGRKADVTRKVARIVKSGKGEVEASNDNFGDPAQGMPKKLRVDYTVNGMPGSKTVNEKDTITFAASTAPPAMVDALCAALPPAPTQAKLALLRILRWSGSPKALKTVTAAAADSDADVKDTALRALCDWPTADALPAVAQLARTSTSPTLKVLALRGFIRLAAQQDAPAAKKVESLKDAMDLASRDGEKRLVLSALGTIPSAESLALVAPYLDSPALKEEACLAAVAIAEQLVKSHPKPVAEAMQKAAKSTANKKLAARANALLRQAKRP